MSSDYAKIVKPVVIVCGDHDRTVPAKLHSYPLHKAIPQSELIVVENAGHELQFTRPEEVIKAIDMAATKSVAGLSPTIHTATTTSSLD
jgi:pimeloyl-ACP methyl ester carboxylesterase